MSTVQVSRSASLVQVAATRPQVAIGVPSVLTHNDLLGRTTADAHPITAITGLSSLAAGDLLIAASPTAAGKVTLGTAGRVMVAGASAPEWSDSLTLTGAAATLTLNTGSRQHAWTARTGVSAFPVPVLYPSATNVIAFDICPNGAPSESAGNGYAWLDVCDTDIRTGAPAVGAARVGILSTHVEFGSRGFDGATAKEVRLSYGGTAKITLTTGGLITLGANTTLTQSAVGASSISVINTGTGTGSFARLSVKADIAANFNIDQFASTYTGAAWGITLAGYAAFSASSSTSNGIIIGHTADKPIIFGISTNEVARFTSGTLASGSFDVKYTGVDSIKTAGGMSFAGTFAGIYVNNGSTAQSVASGAAYAKLTAFTTNDGASNCTADAANDKITITRTGYYLVTGSFSFSGAVANVAWEMAAFLNGTEQTNIHCERKIGAGGDVGAATFSGIIDATSAPLDLDVRARHDNVASQNITIKDASFSVTYIGST